jgi:hypothetical protein
VVAVAVHSIERRNVMVDPYRRWMNEGKEREREEKINLNTDDEISLVGYG